ncbi:MAG: hypothetical protein WC974_06570 [Thermoplasmata archaeon]
MVATSASQIIFFIASVMIAGAVVGVFYVAVNDFASAMDENSHVLAGNLRSDVRFVNQPDMVPYVVYDNNITFYVMNTGISTLNWNKTWIYLTVNGSYREVLDTQLNGNHSRWDPGVILVVTANVTHLEKDTTYTARIEVHDRDSSGRATDSLEFKTLEKNYYLEVTGITDSMIAGTPSSVTVTVLDAYGKNYTGYRGNVSFSSSDAGFRVKDGLSWKSQWEYTSDNFNEVNAPAGSRTFDVNLTTAGEQTVTVTDTADITITGKQTGITINPGAFAKVVFSTNSPNTATAGVPTSPYTVIAMDKYNNINRTTDVTVTLKDNNGLTNIGEFRNTIGGLPLVPPNNNKVTISSGGDGTANFYYYNITPGTYTITITFTGGSDVRLLDVRSP